MHEMLDHYSVVAERESGFWLTLPVSTGQKVSREEWWRLHEKDPEHFQIITIATTGELPLQSTTNEIVVEHALSVSWLDEILH